MLIDEIEVKRMFKNSILLYGVLGEYIMAAY